VPVVTLKFHGDASTDDLCYAKEETFSDSRFAFTTTVVLDATDVENTDLNVLEIVKIAKNDRQRAQQFGKRLIVIAATQKNLLELASVYALEMKDSDWETRVFDNLLAAHAWLGIL